MLKVALDQKLVLQHRNMFNGTEGGSVIQKNLLDEHFISNASVMACVLYRVDPVRD